MPNHVNPSPTGENQPQYGELVRYLVTPLLNFPESLRIDCEFTNQNQRVWIRLALDPQDQGKLFGRGGRNLNAIRTVINAAARAVGQSVYLDIYGVDETKPSVNQTREGTQPSKPPSKPVGKFGKKPGKKPVDKSGKKRKPRKPPKPNLKRSSEQVTPKQS